MVLRELRHFPYEAKCVNSGITKIGKLGYLLEKYMYIEIEDIGNSCVMPRDRKFKIEKIFKIDLR